jgi:hypothetical protein
MTTPKRPNALPNKKETVMTINETKLIEALTCVVNDLMHDANNNPTDPIGLHWARVPDTPPKNIECGYQPS